MAKQIVIDIKPDGTVDLDAQGFEGGDCLLATKELEQLLGERVVQQKKPEFQRRTQNRQTQRANV